MTTRRAALLLALLLPALAQGQTLRMCVDENPNLPFLTPALGGIVGLLVQQAAREVGVKLDVYAAPTTRCREEISAGLADAYPSTPYTPALQALMAYPMHKDKPDPDRAVTNTRQLVYRRKGSPAQWDGKQLSHLKAPVLIVFGSVLLKDRLSAQGALVDDKGKTIEANMNKLLTGRGDVFIAPEHRGAQAQADAQFAGKVEALPLAFTDEPYFFSVSRRFYHAHPEVAENLWNAVGRIRKTAAYQEELQRAMASLDKAAKK